MTSKPITIAIQSQEGQKRVQVSSLAKTEELYRNVQKLFDLTSCQFTLYKKQNKTLEVANSRTKTVKGEGLNHGDRLFMFPKTPLYVAQIQLGIIMGTTIISFKQCNSLK